LKGSLGSRDLNGAHLGHDSSEAKQVAQPLLAVWFSLLPHIAALSSIAKSAQPRVAVLLDPQSKIVS
jgi:hypothetical protein